MSATRTRVFSAFRRLNRARIQLFQGDDHAMAVTHQQMRAEFQRNKNVPTSGPEFEALVVGIDEAATMLKHEIIRGDLNQETGRYGTYPLKRVTCEELESSESTCKMGTNEKQCQ